tara:strand:- start:1161 stop:1379 length:219 start_codon:yes stop_codon:yes gene_type:complete
MNFDTDEIIIRIIKYLIIIIIITLIVIFIPKQDDRIREGIFLGLISASIYALYDNFIPAIPNDIKKKLNLIK